MGGGSTRQGSGRVPREATSAQGARGAFVSFAAFGTALAQAAADALATGTLMPPD